MQEYLKELTENSNLSRKDYGTVMSPTREAPASLSPVDPIGLAIDYRSRDIQKLLHESPRRKRIDETMRVPSLSTLPEEEWDKESNDMESCRRLEEVRRYSNNELKVSRELIEAVRGQKDYSTLGKLKSFQYVSGIPGMAYNPFVNEGAGEAYFDYEQVVVLDFWVERVKEIGMLMMEQPRLGIVLEERVVEPSVPELKGQVSFDCGSWDGP